MFKSCLLVPFFTFSWVSLFSWFLDALGSLMRRHPRANTWWCAALRSGLAAWAPCARIEAQSKLTTTQPCQNATAIPPQYLPPWDQGIYIGKYTQKRSGPMEGSTGKVGGRHFDIVLGLLLMNFIMVSLGHLLFQFIFPLFNQLHYPGINYFQWISLWFP